MSDISATLEPDSTQLNAIDFVAGPHTFTVAGVRVKTCDQPVDIDLVEVNGRAYRPSKSMRRVLAACWSPDSSTWTGKQFTLYCDPTVKWGGKAIGGIKISAMSHLDGPREVMLQESSTVRKPHRVEPLVESKPGKKPAPTGPTPKQIAECDVPEILRGWWRTTTDVDLRALIEKRVSELPAEAAS